MQKSSYESLSHSKWDCKYHVVFIPKGRRKILFGNIRAYLGHVLRELALRKECKILEGNMSKDHVHIVISIPPKYSVSAIIGYIKGKSAIAVARQYEGVKRNFSGHKFWARGYAVSTVGFDLDKVRAYVKDQQNLDRGCDEDGNF